MCKGCDLQRCHYCRDPNLGRFWMPHCWGGVNEEGRRNGCSCWPRTERMKADDARQAKAHERRALRRFQQRVRVHNQRTDCRDVPPLQIIRE